MLTGDQHAALLMVIADLRIQLANTQDALAFHKKLLADQQVKAEADADGNSHTAD